MFDEISIEIRPSFRPGLFIRLFTEDKKYYLECKGNINIVNSPRALDSLFALDNNWKFELPLKDFNDLQRKLYKIQVTAVPEFSTGLDGTTYEISIQNGFNYANYTWWEDPPMGWKKFKKVINEFTKYTENKIKESHL